MLWTAESNTHVASGLALAQPSQGIFFLGATLDESCRAILEETFQCSIIYYFPRIDDYREISKQIVNWRENYLTAF